MGSVSNVQDGDSAPILSHKGRHEGFHPATQRVRFASALRFGVCFFFQIRRWKNRYRELVGRERRVNLRGWVRFRQLEGDLGGNISWTCMRK